MDGISIGTSHGARGVATGVRVEIDSEKLGHVNALLRAFPERALTVYERALRRGLAAGKTQAMKEIRERYDIPLSSLTEKHTYYTFSERVDRDAGGVAGYISFAGRAIPLYRFNPSPKARRYTARYVNGISGWRVTTDVRAADVRGSMRRTGGFIATFQSGRTGIFSRYDSGGSLIGTTASGKAALRELYGFSVGDMLSYLPAQAAIEARMRETIERRIDHELLRALEEVG